MPHHPRVLSSLGIKVLNRLSKSFRKIAVAISSSSNVLRGCAERLLTNYGCENIYMPLTESPDLEAILSTIGQPLVVECELNPANLKTFMDYPWGTIWLSTYHKSINPRADVADQDGKQFCPVPPEKIAALRNSEDAVLNSKRERIRG
jgi:hypothetical protein